MPSISAKQQKLFGLALALKRGKRLKAGGPARKIAKSMGIPKIKEFSSTKDFK